MCGTNSQVSPDHFTQFQFEQFPKPGNLTSGDLFGSLFPSRMLQVAPHRALSPGGQPDHERRPWTTVNSDCRLFYLTFECTARSQLNLTIFRLSESAVSGYLWST